MAWQLIFTSAPRTLSAGQSGYGTVARSADLREGLAQRLEQLSYYGHAAGQTRRHPVVCAYRILDVRGTKYHALTRIQDAGLDFTHRTNHLAHHLVFAPEELPALPPPTVIFQHWNGWRTDWRGEPRLLDAGDWDNFDQLPRKVTLPAQAWQQTTGDAGSAAALLERPCVNGCYLLAGPDEEPPLLALFGESLQLLDSGGQSPAKLWQHPFTTLLQAEDHPLDFCWRGCAAETAAQRGIDAPVIVPATLRAPAGALAQLARQGSQPIPKPSALPATPDAMSLPTVTRLSLQGTPPRVPPRSRDEVRQAPTSARARDRGRTATPDFISPRGLLLVVVLVAVVGLLLGGFVWPGFLKTQSPVAAVVPKATHTSARDRTITDPPPRAILSVSKSPNANPPPPAPPPSDAALSQLRERFTTLETKTYLYLCEPNQDRLTFAPGPGLALLLKEFFTDSAVPLNPDLVECFLDSDRLDLESPKPPPLALKVDSTGGQKSLHAENAAGLGFTLSAADWLKDSHQPLSLVTVGSPSKVLKILLRPAAGQNNFPPFRLVLVFDAAAPVQLSKSLLLTDRKSFENSLGPDLFARWKALVRAGVAGCQFRPFTKSVPPQDLLDRLHVLPARLRPASGAELDFTPLRERTVAEAGRHEAQAAKLSAQIAGLDRQIEENNNRDLLIGKRLGLKADELRSFAAFAQAERSEPGHRCFEAYLGKLAARCKLGKPAQDLIPNSRTPDEKAVANLTQFHSALVAAGHEKGLADVPQDYFAKRWEELGLVKKRNDLAKLREVAQKAAADLRGLLDVTPASLAETPLVKLFLLRSNGLPPVEFIQFADPPPKTPAP